MSILWTSADMAAATNGKASKDFTATGVSIDTRTLKKGEAYLALKGEQLDGHAYVRKCLQGRCVVRHRVENLCRERSVVARSSPSMIR